MKKLSFLFVFTFLIFACNNDDDTVDACDKATNIQVNTITTTSATITWSDSNAAGSYFLEYGESGFAIGSGTTVIETNTTTDLQNLLPETTYDVYVQVVCSTDNLSMYSDVFSFTTATLPVVPEFRPTTNNSPLMSSAKAEKPPLNWSSKVN